MKCFLPAIFAILMAQASGSVIHVDSILIPTAEARLALQESARALVASRNDLPALEKLIAHFAPEVLDSINSNSGYSFSDPVRQEAYNALMDWYSIDFLETALKKGSEDSAYWALRKLSHQAINADDPRLAACKGMVTPEVRTRLIPALEDLRSAKSGRTRDEAAKFARGLLLDRGRFLKSLQEPDEAALNASLMQTLDKVSFDPNLAGEVWDILAKAQTDSLAGTCLRYPWLFELPAWDDAKARLLVRCFSKPGTAASTNAHSALIHLAMGNNPLARSIFASLDAFGDQALKERVREEYRALHQNNHP